MNDDAGKVTPNATENDTEHDDSASDASRRRFLIGSAGAIAAGSAMGMMGGASDATAGASQATQQGL